MSKKRKHFKENFNNAEMTNAEMNNAELTNEEMTNAEMTNAEMNNAELTNEEMTNAEMTNAEMTNAEMNNAEITNEEMNNAEMNNVEMNNEEINNEEITNEEITNEEMNNAEMNNAEMNNAEINNVEMNNVEMNNEEINNEEINNVDSEFTEKSAGDSEADLKEVNEQTNTDNTEEINTEELKKSTLLNQTSTIDEVDMSIVEMFVDLPLDAKETYLKTADIPELTRKVLEKLYKDYLKDYNTVKVKNKNIVLQPWQRLDEQGNIVNQIVFMGERIDYIRGMKHQYKYMSFNRKDENEGLNRTIVAKFPKGEPDKIDEVELLGYKIIIKKYGGSAVCTVYDPDGKLLLDYVSITTVHDVLQDILKPTYGVNAAQIDQIIKCKRGLKSRYTKLDETGLPKRSERVQVVDISKIIAEVRQEAEVQQEQNENKVHAGIGANLVNQMIAKAHTAK